MKKSFILFASALVCCTGNVAANNATEESLDTIETSINLSELVVTTRANVKTPMAYTTVKAHDLEKVNKGQDLPYLLSTTPSVVTTSDAGNGVGYTSIRVRGVDATRVNITANGIPINDSESQSVFWVNMPDFASSLKDVQVQRGAGTSTNGAGAFGASIDMRTEDIPTKTFAEVDGAYGSFNTHKATVKLGTGLLANHWGFEARLSNIGSDGYLERAKSSLNSYFVQGGYFTDDMSIRLLTFGGKERTYHAWNYSTASQIEAFGRKFNSCGYMGAVDAAGNFSQPEIDYDYGIAEAADIIKNGGHLVYYDGQTDNYLQNHYQLLFNKNWNKRWVLNLGAHYTRGEGYYEEYKLGRKLVQYGLENFVIDGEKVKKSDLIRQKNMLNHFGGGVFSVTYRGDKLTATVGGAANHYVGNHFGKVLWVKNYIGTINPNDEYYRNKGKKTDANIYGKVNYDIIDGLSVYGDLQYRFVRYILTGHNDKYDTSKDDFQSFDVNDRFNFFNPKVGVNWVANRHNRLFASWSVAHKEPTRNNYTDGYLNHNPMAERLFDYELGYVYANRIISAGVNLYYMDYKDQLVLTGELNEIGEPVAANVAKSYRAGVELSANLHPVDWFNWDFNVSLSKNRIKNFTETLYGYDEDWNDLPAVEINHGDTHIAFSPDVVFNNSFNFNVKGFDATLHSQYVGKQYMSNADIEDHKLKAYFVTNLHLGYTFKLPKVKEVRVGLSVYNLFSEKYSNNGWASSDYTGHMEGGKPVMDARNNYAGYAVQAPTNVMASLGFKF